MAVVGILFSAAPLLRCGFEADSLDECVKVIDDAVIEAVELRPLLIRDFGVGADGAEETLRKRRVDADGIPLRQELVAA